MTAWERLRRVLFLSSLLLFVIAVSMVFVNAWAAVALVALAGAVFGLAFTLGDRWRGERVSRGGREETSVPQLVITPEVLSPKAPSSAASRDAARSFARPGAWRAGLPLTWLWLAGPLVLGVALGVLVNRWLPGVPAQAPSNARLEGRPDDALVSPLVEKASERESERGLVRAQIDVQGESVEVLHSKLDIGQVSDLFDADFGTLIRGKSANPFIFEVRYSQPKTASEVVLDLARMSDFQITVQAITEDGDALTFGDEYMEEMVDPTLAFAIPGGAQPIRSIRVEIVDRRAPPQEGFHTHVRGFQLR